MAKSKGKGGGKGAGHGPSIKNAPTYEHLKEQGMTKSKAAAISNSQFNKRGGRPTRHHGGHPSRKSG